MKNLLFGLLLFLTSCNTLEINISVPYYRLDQPPTWYKTAWEETYTCAGKLAKKPKKQYSEIRWFVTGTESFMLNGEAAVGAYLKGDILLTITSQHMKWVVQHEQMHAITGIMDHPWKPFGACRLYPDQQRAP